MTRPRLVGMTHLPALPGTPAAGPGELGPVVEHAIADARTLAEAGFDAVLVQNSLDRPTRERVDALAVAQLAVVTDRVRQATDLLVGVNVIKNDGPAAIAVAAAAGADFVRIKVLTGSVLSAEGVLEGCAPETLALRSRSGSRAAIWADCYEPTSRPLVADDFDAAVVDALDFGMADAVIVTGRTTEETLVLAEHARKRQPDAHLVIGGRVGVDSAAAALAIADTVIIGSALKARPGIAGRVDPGKARELAAAAGSAL
jgi:membrane complex biogenesis BtpA family protein